MILVVGHNSTWQKTYRLKRIKIGEVNRIESALGLPAGKGVNVSRALRLLGLEALLLGYAGGMNGERFRRALEEEGLKAEFQAIEEETRICTTLIEDQTTTELIEPSPRISEEEREAFSRLFLQNLINSDLLVISGTSVNGEREDCYKSYILEAKKRNIPVLLDSFRTRARDALEAEPEILKINLDELESIYGKSLKEREERENAYRDLRRRYNLSWIVISRGEKGLEGLDRGSFFRAVPPKVSVINPIGSGDSVAAGIAAGFLAGRDFRSALLTGTAMGTANCLNITPGLVNKKDYERIRDAVRIELIRN